MSHRTTLIDNIPVPRFIYGTAWKENETARLTRSALEAGFRGIDTANQRKHYHEAEVGRAIAKSIDDGIVAREELFLQTKFTFRRGQDNRLPYDPDASISIQVAQSFASSLEHLQTDRIESYILHGPSSSPEFGADDWEAWRAMEAICDSGQTRFLGVSNVSLEQLTQLCSSARVQPRFAQIRCYAINEWDKEMRQFCKDNDIVYQGFSLLTANRNVLTHPIVQSIATRHQCTPEQTIFRFALDVGMIPLTGTTSAKHMKTDLEAFDLSLSVDEIAKIERVAIKHMV
jgi:diketogulonate reductase-like aldo/keto reductase